MNPDTPCPSTDDLLDEPLLNAYLATTYQVLLDGEWEDVRIGQTHPRLDRMTGAQCWTIITAFNPASHRLTDSENQQRHARLQERAAADGLACRSTRHIAADRNWPTEKGLFIADPDDDWVHQQAREFGQLGTVHGHRHAHAELWLYGELWAQASHPQGYPNIKSFD